MFESINSNGYDKSLFGLRTTFLIGAPFPARSKAPSVPKGVFGEVENIHIITRKGLEEDQPKVVEFLKSFKLTESDLGDLMGAIEEDTRESLDVARDWMNAHDELVQGWMIQ